MMIERQKDKTIKKSKKSGLNEFSGSIEGILFQKLLNNLQEVLSFKEVKTYYSKF